MFSCPTDCNLPPTVTAEIHLVFSNNCAVSNTTFTYLSTHSVSHLAFSIRKQHSFFNLYTPLILLYLTVNSCPPTYFAFYSPKAHHPTLASTFASYLPLEKLLAEEPEHESYRPRPQKHRCLKHPSFLL